MQCIFDSIARNLFSSFWIKEFSSSQDYTLRLSLFVSDVRKDTLINDGFEVLFENSYFSELSDLYSQSPELKSLTQKELVFSAIHNYQVFLHCCKSSGFEVVSTGDSEYFTADDSIEFRSTIYKIKMVRVEDCVKLVDSLYAECADLWLLSMIVFLSSRLEFIQ